MNNIVIESLDKEHGGKVIEFFKSQGILTDGLAGSNTLESGATERFYGVINNRFYAYSEKDVKNAGAKIVKLTSNLKTKQVEMNVFKTQNLSINGVERLVTVAVAVVGGLVRTGYAVLLPTDEPNPELANKIAMGRALSDKTNLTPDMLIDTSMMKKYILYAVADQYLKVLSDGKVIKGIKDLKK